MASKYQQDLKIPEGFPELLKAFTREILRDQPSNIFDFAANYFAAKRQNGGMPSTQDVKAAAEHIQSTSPPPREAIHAAIIAKDQASMSDAVYEVFTAADTDQSGTLDRSEFAAALRSGRLDLSDRLINRVLADADDNADGVIQYSEFIPTMLDIVAAEAAIPEPAGGHAANDLVAAVRAASSEALLYSMTSEQFEGAVSVMCERADAMKTGKLNKQVFKACLQAQELGLTRKDVNLLMGHVVPDASGEVDYKAFAPACYGILGERFTAQAARNALCATDQELEKHVMHCFRHFDVEGNGELPCRMVRHALTKISDDVVPLTVYQMHVLVAAGCVDELGIIRYAEMAPLVVRTLRTLLDTQHMRARAAAVGKLAHSDMMMAMSGQEGAQLEGALHEALSAADTSGSGMLSGCTVANTLLQLAAKMGERPRLEPAVWQSLLTAVDTDNTGAIDWCDLVAFLTMVFQHIVRERELDKLQNGGVEDVATAAANVQAARTTECAELATAEHTDGGAAEGSHDASDSEAATVAQGVLPEQEDSLSAVAVQSGEHVDDGANADNKLATDGGDAQA